MNKNPLFIAFCTQKGGVGKSTMTTLFASSLHYEKGYNVAVIDCDFPQHTVYDIRQRETEIILNNEYFKRMAFEHFKTLGKKAYPIEVSSPDEAIDKARELIQTSVMQYDIILFDMPGTINTKGVLQTASQMDYIFCPITADQVTIKSTLMFADTLRKVMEQNAESMIKGIHMYWTQVDGREKTELYGVYESIFEKMDFNVLKTNIPDSKRFRKEISDESRTIFRTTMFPPDKKLAKGSNVEDWIQEIIHITGI